MAAARPVLSAAATRGLRIRAQGLVGQRATTVPAAVRRVLGLQAQDTKAARLSVRVRTEGLDAAAVTAACNEDRSVVRTWGMRGTLHMMAAEDVGWVLGVLGPRFTRAARGRRQQLGLDDKVITRGMKVLNAVLAETGPLTRAEVLTRLARHGVELDPRSQALAHLLAYAGMTGLVCRGPDVAADEPTYVLVCDWVGEQRPWDPDEALAELARRYVIGHGPVTAEDFAAWSGLPLGTSRQGFAFIAGELAEVEAAGARAWVSANTPLDARPDPSSRVRLLGPFDTYLLAYRTRALAADPRVDHRIRGGGWIHAVVLVDGRAVGTWRLAQVRRGMLVSVRPFGRLAKRVLPGLRAEVKDLGRFLGADAGLSVEDV